MDQLTADTTCIKPITQVELEQLGNGRKIVIYNTTAKNGTVYTKTGNEWQGSANETLDINGLNDPQLRAFVVITGNPFESAAAGADTDNAASADTGADANAAGAGADTGADANAADGADTGADANAADGAGADNATVPDDAGAEKGGGRTAKKRSGKKRRTSSAKKRRGASVKKGRKSRNYRHDKK